VDVVGKRLRVLIAVISVAATMLVVPSVGQLVASGSAGAAAADTQQFTGRDIYAPDIIPNPNGQGYVMWYGGWQTQQAVNAGQLDTIFQRTSPTPNGPWSNPTTDILSSQVAAAASEVNDPSVSVVSVGTSYLYTMFFTVLSCDVGCNNQVWSATSGDGNHWASFKQLVFTDAYGLDASSPSVVLEPSGAQRWTVYYGADCVIGVASVDANRDLLTSSIAYRGSGSQCMSNPDVFQSGSRWYMFFNVQETIASDATRFNVWQINSASATDWSPLTSTPVIQEDGVQRCSALTPFVLPVTPNQFNIYYGLVLPGTYGQCTDLTNSTSIMLAGNPPLSPPSPVYPPAQSCVGFPTGSVTGMAPGLGDVGYWIVNAAGQVDACGSVANSYGELPSAPPSPIVGITATPNGKGYWLVASDGSIFSFGNAPFHGSTGGFPLNAPIVGMAVDPATGGYWIDASDGGVFAFDAPYRGSMGGSRLNRPMVGMAVDPANAGYWLVGADGGIFSFGNAPFHGSTGSLGLNRPIVGMEASPSGAGYRFVADDGGVFSFGSSQFYGSAA
jgi:hypothetical protein